MIETADKAGVLLGVNFPWRFRFSVQKAGELLRSGITGKILGVKLHHIARKPDTYWHQGYTGRAKTDWRTRLALSGGGYLIMNLIHNIDYMVPLIGGEPVRIYAEYDTFVTPVEVEDYVAFVMRMSTGVIFTAEGTSTVPGQDSLGDRIYAEHAQISIMWNQVRVYLTQQYGDIKPGEWVSIKPPAGTVDPVVRHFQLFTDSILNKTQPPVSGREGRKALEIVRGAYLSMKRGAPVTFPVTEE
jgi:predicted dehydrogenase